MSKLSRQVAKSPLAAVAALPIRVAAVARHDVTVVRSSLAWLASSREHTNFTYDLSSRNMRHLASWISGITGSSYGEANAWIREIAEDGEFADHVTRCTKASPRWRLADEEVRLGRRLGWYALVRAIQPDLVVETGTDKGLGSCVIAAALLANGKGRLVTIDVNPDSGFLIQDKYASVVEHVIDDSVEALGRLTGAGIDLFLHDSWHSREHESAEFASVLRATVPPRWLLSDNSDQTDVLHQLAIDHDWPFYYFREEPIDHWVPGQGIGLVQTLDE